MKSASGDKGAQPYIERFLDLPRLLAKRSHFLLGPRQTGKSFLIAHTLPEVRLYDLLEHSTYISLTQNPGGSQIAACAGGRTETQALFMR